ncbi:MAG: DUF2764 family protein [Methyloprofundus sp.]|nr:DUF2764 family protein [Methyloprofundus sp.]
MKRRNAYAMLMSGLQPHPLSLWDLENKPASRIHLERRLTLLQDQDRQQLEQIVSILHWARMDAENSSDAKIAAEAERVIQSIDNPLLRETIIWRMELRTIMTAIRRRKLGMNAPPKNQRWGYGQVVPFILKNWQIEDFSLSHRFIWIKQANMLFETEQSVELEKLLLNLSWQHYERIGQAHYFDFEAVVIYVLRWNIVHRWVQCDKQIAMQQFEKLVNDGLGEYLEDKDLS